MGVRLALGPHVSPEVRKSIYRGAYERVELRALRRCLDRDDVVLEIGTGLGFVAVYLAQRLGADRVHTFEANPALEAPIRRNFSLNGVYPYLAIGVLGAAAGSTELKVGADFWTASTVDVRGTHRCVTVPLRPLNETIRRIDPSLLVVDIEGGERQLAEEIDLHNIRRIVIELHPDIIGADGCSAVRSRFVAAGFRESWSCGGGRYALFVRAHERSNGLGR